MDVRNRMADVVKLRCNVCQDFIRMILKEGWQKELYKKAQEEITSNGRFKDKYIPTYEQMRNSENGIDDYSVDDMDVTLITELVEANFRGKFPGIKSVEDVTRIALKELRDDRNRTNHSNENEEADELYLCGLLALCNLREFVRTVDKVEKGIDDEQRLAYRQMYIPKIEELKGLLDDERIELIQKKKNMRKDVQRVLESDDPRTWEEVSWLYLNRSKLERNKDLLNEFMVCASDAGLEQGHFSAALYFMYPLRDYKEAERRLFMLYNSKSEHTSYDARELLSAINFYLELGNEITVGMQEIIDGLSERGFNIEKSEGGFYGLVEENDSAYKAEQENYKVDVQKVIKEVLSRKKNNRHLTSHNNHRGKK